MEDMAVGSTITMAMYTPPATTTGTDLATTVATAAMEATAMVDFHPVVSVVEAVDSEVAVDSAALVTLSPPVDLEGLLMDTKSGRWRPTPTRR